MKNGNVTILLFSEYYVPGYKAGGPITTLHNLVTALSGEFKFRIVTGNNDLNETDPYPGIESDRWIDTDDASVLYLSKRKRTLRSMVSILKETSYDVLYLNSFFSNHFSILPLIARKIRKSNKPVIIAPRGEFFPGALAIKKRKKDAYLRLSALTGLYNDVIWQASTDIEKYHIDRLIKSVTKNIVITPNIIDIKAFGSYQRQKEKGELNIAFVSRINPKKNLDFALKVLMQMDIKISFTIYGPIDHAVYWNECQKLIKNMPKNISVRYHGPVSPEKINSVFGDSHLLFLPTKGENFGHVIIESLASGCPVLISDQTPWTNVSHQNAGCSVPLNHEQGYQSYLNKVYSMGTEDYNSLCAGARQYAHQYLQKNNKIELHKTMFKEIAGGGINE